MHKLSDERLAEMAILLELRDVKPPFHEIAAILTELQSLRSKPVAGVEVKPLEWVKRHEGEFLSRVETIVGVYRVWSHHEDSGEWFWSLSQTDKNYLGFGPSDGSEETEDAAKASVNADYRQRIFSTLSYSEQEPAELDGRVEIIEQSDTMDGGTALTLRQYDQEVVAVVYFPPSHSQPEAVITATHRHKKRGTEYVLIGIGKMQAEGWHASAPGFAFHVPVPVDMSEVAVYRSVDNPNEIWVRPRGEFEDGRFAALKEA